MCWIIRNGNSGCCFLGSIDTSESPSFQLGAPLVVRGSPGVQCSQEGCANPTDAKAFATVNPGMKSETRFSTSSWLFQNIHTSPFCFGVLLNWGLFQWR